MLLPNLDTGLWAIPPAAFNKWKTRTEAPKFWCVLTTNSVSRRSDQTSLCPEWKLHSCFKVEIIEWKSSSAKPEFRSGGSDPRIGSYDHGCCALSALFWKVNMICAFMSKFSVKALCTQQNWMSTILMSKTTASCVQVASFASSVSALSFKAVWQV